MNDRPSTGVTNFFSIKSLQGERSARSIRSRLVGFVGLVAFAVLGAISYGGLFFLKKSMAGDENARILNAASLSRQLVDRVLAERARQVDLIVSSPQVVAAAK